MNELESFFQDVSNPIKDPDDILETILFVGVNEWHITPKELLSWDIPLVSALLIKRHKMNENGKL